MALSHLVVQYESNFCTVALQFMEEEKNYPLPSPATTGARGRPQSLRHLPGRCRRPGPLGRAGGGTSAVPHAGSDVTSSPSPGTQQNGRGGAQGSADPYSLLLPPGWKASLRAWRLGDQRAARGRIL